MANIKSAKKRIGVIKKKTEQNKSAKSEINTAVKKFKTAPTAEGLSSVMQLLDKAAQDNIIHKNKAARIKAQVSKLLEKKGA